MNGSGTQENRLWRRGDTHHGPGHIARLNPRGHHRDQPPGRHVAAGTPLDLTEADYADRLRRSAGWTPKHRADDA